MKGLALLVGGASAVHVCDSYWEASFKGENNIFNDGDSGLVGDTGVYGQAHQACQACVEALVGTKSCPDFTSKKCFASSLAVDFEEKNVEKVDQGELTTAEGTKQDKLSGSSVTEWTYVTGGGDGAVPEGAKECGPVLYRHANPDADDANVDGACADQSRPMCGDMSQFEECCMGTRPQNTLCNDGQGCEGQENTITIGKEDE